MSLPFPRVSHLQSAKPDSNLTNWDKNSKVVQQKSHNPGVKKKAIPTAVDYNSILQLSADEPPEMVIYLKSRTKSDWTVLYSALIQTNLFSYAVNSLSVHFSFSF